MILFQLSMSVVTVNQLLDPTVNMLSYVCWLHYWYGFVLAVLIYTQTHPAYSILIPDGSKALVLYQILTPGGLGKGPQYLSIIL